MSTVAASILIISKTSDAAPKRLTMDFPIPRTGTRQRASSKSTKRSSGIRPRDGNRDPSAQSCGGAMPGTNCRTLHKANERPRAVSPHQQQAKEFIMSKEAENKAVVGRWFKEFWGNPWNPKVVEELGARDILLQYSLHERAAAART